MNYSIEILNNCNFKTTSWSGGTTTEFAIYPPKSVYKDLDFIWRISSATVDLEESTFTSLPNITRFITPLNGILKLKHNNDDLITLNPFDINKFSGNYNTKSFGKVRDFNLMIGQTAVGYLSKEYLTLNYSPIDISYKEDNSHFKTLFKIFFSPFSDINFMFENSKKIILHKNELLLLKFNIPFHKPNIKVSSSSYRNIMLTSSILC